jgi:hypothetical protein
LTIIISCQSIPKNIYESKGLNFEVTEDFTITETKTWKHNHATYIKIEPRTKDLYSKISVTWLPKKFDLDKELQNFVESLKEGSVGDLQNTPVFSEVRSTKFGSNEARYIDYVIGNGRKSGSYTTFHCDSLTVIIGQHYNPESQAMTNRGRQIIEETHNCIGQGIKK